MPKHQTSVLVEVWFTQTFDSAEAVRKATEKPPYIAESAKDEITPTAGWVIESIECVDYDNQLVED